MFAQPLQTQRVVRFSQLAAAVGTPRTSQAFHMHLFRALFALPYLLQSTVSVHVL